MSRFRISHVVLLAVLALARRMLTATAAPAAAGTTYAITGLSSMGYGVSDALVINAGQVTGIFGSNPACIPAWTATARPPSCPIPAISPRSPAGPA